MIAIPRNDDRHQIGIVIGFVGIRSHLRSLRPTVLEMPLLNREIAKQVATECAPQSTRYEALVEYLIQVSPDVTPQNISRRRPEYTSYRGLINFDNMMLLFGEEDYDVIYEIYNEIKSYYREQFLFWLQYGRAELHFDNFANAENYLNQSLGIRSADEGNFQALHRMGLLYLKRALWAETIAIGEQDAKRGEQLLYGQVKSRGMFDTYPCQALVTHKLRWLQYKRGPRFGEEIEGSLNLAEEAVSKHRYDEGLKEAYERVYREYLMSAVPVVEQQRLPLDSESDGGNRE